MALLATLVAELRRRALGISAEEIRYTFEDVRSEIRAVRAELREELASLRRELGVPSRPDLPDEDEDEVPEAKAWAVRVSPPSYEKAKAEYTAAHFLRAFARAETVAARLRGQRPASTASLEQLDGKSAGEVR